MRKIKFRGRRLSDGKWIFGNLILTDDGHAIIQPWIRTEGVGYTHPEDNTGEVDPKTVGGFCDFYDHSDNKNEVYEGDILDVLEVSENGTLNYQSPVEWVDCGFIVTEPSGTQVPLACFSEPARQVYPLYEIKVIGTIHDKYLNCNVRGGGNEGRPADQG